MKYFFTYMVSAMISVTQSFSQQNMRSDHIVDRTIGAVVAREFQPKQEKVESVFLNEEWRPGNIVFSSGDTLRSLPVRYDLKNNLIEIKYGDDIKILSVHKCRALEIDDPQQRHSFVNGNLLTQKGISGLAEPLAQGALTLYARPYLEVYKANYNAAMDVGNRNDRYLIREQLYLVTQQGSVVDVTKAGKKMLDYFGDRSGEIEKYARENGLSFKKRDDIVSLIKRFNELG